MDNKEKDEDWLARVTKELKPLHERMDSDRRLCQLERFPMKDYNGLPLKDVSNITLNDPLVFANMVESRLNAATMQMVVEGTEKELSDKEITELEDFYHATLDAAHLSIRRMQSRIPSLRVFATQQVDIRGVVAARIYLRMDGNKFVPDILPCDTRFLLWEADEDGLLKSAYQTERSKQRTKAEYGVDIAGETATVTDIWDRD